MQHASVLQYVICGWDEQACKAVQAAVLAYTEAMILGQSSQSAQWLDDIYARRTAAFAYGR